MKNIIKPDPISLTTHQLHFKYSRTDYPIASGTGFIYEFASKFFLITNWHNVTGKNPITGGHLSANCAEPDVFTIFFRDKDSPETCWEKTLCLYKDNDMKEPAWFEHPTYKEKVDVVAIDINAELKENYQLFPINNIPFEESIPPEVSDDVFTVGYPFAEHAYLHMPIWKKGSIASEPQINLAQTPKLYIDTATRPGLSGSPVIYQRIGTHNIDKNGIPEKNAYIGRMRGFLGVYSGRFGSDEKKAQLGIVWKASVIDEILSNVVK